MANGKPIQVPGTVWFTKTSASPVISTQDFAALAFALEPGTSTLGTTVVLSASYLLGWPYTELYGNQLPKPIVVVAIDASSGNAYLSDINVTRTYQTEEAIYLGLCDQDANQPGPTQNRMRMGGYFNVDLPALLGLPPESGYYQVFVWLDDLVTAIQTVQVPANEARRGIKPGLYQVTGSNLVTVRTSTQSPTAKTGEIRTDLDTSSRSLRVYATLPPGALQTPPTGIAPGNPVLTILAHNRQAQSFAWYVSADAYRSMQSQNVASFDFDPFQIIARPDPPANVFVVTVLGNVRNDVLPILTDFQR
jgi:hypothetical protein